MPTLRNTVAAACLLATGMHGHALAAAAPRVDPAAVSQRIVREVNAFREQQGRRALQVDERLVAAAQDFAAHLARTGRLSHEADGRTPAQRARQHGYAYCIVDENIGYEQRNSGFDDQELAQRLVEGWKRSPPHRHNILDADVSETAVALAYESTTGRWFAVQMFAAPHASRSVFEVSNATAGSVRYRLGEQAFDLAPRVIRSHQECRPRAIVLESAGPGASIAQPRDGDRYRVVRDRSGSLLLERE